MQEFSQPSVASITRELNDINSCDKIKSLSVLMQRLIMQLGILHRDINVNIILNALFVFRI